MTIFINCQSNQSVKSEHIDKEDYPQEIVGLGVERLYDKTKWYIYCSSADRKVKFRPELNIVDTNLTYGMLPLNFELIEVRADSIEINFYFSYNDRKLDVLTVLNEPAWGCVYIGKSEKIREITSTRYYRYTGVVCEDTANCPDLFDDIDMLRLTQFVNLHKDKLAPWFRKEAIQRGVIKE